MTAHPGGQSPSGRLLLATLPGIVGNEVLETASATADRPLLERSPRLISIAVTRSGRSCTVTRPWVAPGGLAVSDNGPYRTSAMVLGPHAALRTVRRAAVFHGSSFGRIAPDRFGVPLPGLAFLDRQVLRVAATVVGSMAFRTP